MLRTTLIQLIQNAIHCIILPINPKCYHTSWYFESSKHRIFVLESLNKVLNNLFNKRKEFFLELHNYCFDLVVEVSEEFFIYNKKNIKSL